MSVYQLERDGDVSELLAVLEGSDSAAVRERAAESLGAFDPRDADEPIVDRLIAAAEDDPSRDVRAAAIDALDELGQDAVEELLVSMGGIGAGDDRADRTAVRAFVAALDHEIPELRMAAANAVGRAADPEAVPGLVDALDDGDPRVRVRAARALARIGDPRAGDALVAATDDPATPVRREALVALGDLEGAAGLEAALDALDDGSPAVRRAAATALGGFAGAEPVEPLVGALTDEDDRVRRAAVYSLIELLSNVPTERSHELRETVVDALNAADEGVTGPLIEMLNEGTQAQQRRNAAWLLGRVAGEGTRDRIAGALVDALGDDDQLVTQFAATSLAEIGGETVEDALLSALDESEGAERAGIVFALGKVGGERSRERLGAVIDETDDEEVRKRAFAALSRLGGRP